MQDAIKETAIDHRISKEQAEAYKICIKLRNFIEDTIDIKEIDLKKEFDKCCENYMFDDECEVYTARHFFELGLNINKV